MNFVAIAKNCKSGELYRLSSVYTNQEQVERVASRMAEGLRDEMKTEKAKRRICVSVWGVHSPYTTPALQSEMFIEKNGAIKPAPTQRPL